LFIVQSLLSIRALRWQETGFDERPDRWLGYLAQAAEWFPLLGLLGTVAAILQTFGSMTGQITPQEIIRKYAPAITATGSGLFMALLNILPLWMVNAGRDLILLLAGEPRVTGEKKP
jgi:biopolymer transport protein ExbB/TolQ